VTGDYPASAVGHFKEVYRRASKGQRATMRAWMRRVLSGEDGNDKPPLKRRQGRRAERSQP
jgi:hypothetical protein